MHAVGRAVPALRTAVHISSGTGVASFPDHGADETQLSISTDLAIHQAKQRGRSRVVLLKAAN